MRICLINPLYGANSSISYSPPLGLAYIASSLEKNGHQIKIIDRVSLKYKDGEIGLGELDKKTEKEILNFEPNLIGIGAMTIQIYDTQRVARLIRSIPGGKNYPLIAGGFHPTAEPELTLKECPEIDAVCQDEGELTMLKLASGESYENVDGMTFKKNNQVLSTGEKCPIADLDNLPVPARHLLDMEFYTRLNEIVIPNVPARVTTLITSRGCPFSCRFCANKLIYKTVRFHSVKYTIDEIYSILENYKVEALYFVDTEFLANRKRIELLCHELIDRKLNKKFRWACSARVDSVNDKILKLMKKAGCFFINYGFESGSQRMLDSMNKKTTVEQNSGAAMLTNKAHILVNSAFITNLPGENEDDLIATMQFIKNTKIYCTGLNNLLPLPGSPYYTELFKNGVLTYSDKLWEEIGALQSLDSIKIFSDMPKDRFIKLSRAINEMIARNNTKNYIRANWFRYPYRSAKRLLELIVLDLYHISGRILPWKKKQ
ncbi:MAG: radical SAM protein [Dehalococcoidales bacterium]